MEQTAAAALRAVWRYVADRGLGSTPAARLAALACTVRAASRRGVFNMGIGDLPPLAETQACAALAELARSGWLAIDLDRACAARSHASATVGEFAVPESAPLSVTKLVRRRWIWHQEALAGHGGLPPGDPASILLAAYVALHADGARVGTLPWAESARDCALGADDEDRARAALVTAGWLATESRAADGTWRFALGAGATAFTCSPPPAAPAPRTARGRPATTSAPAESTPRRTRAASKRHGTDAAVPVPRAARPDRARPEPERLLVAARAAEIAESCTVCAADGIVNRAPVPRSAVHDSVGRRLSLTGRQAAVLQRLLRYLAWGTPEGGAEITLAGLWFAAARLGEDTGCEETTAAGIPLPDPAETVRALRRTGGDVALNVDAHLLEIGRQSAAHLGGWVHEILTHPWLHATAPEVRLGAVFVTAHADHRGRIETSRRELAAACRASAADVAIALEGCRWIRDVIEVPGRRIRARLAPASFPYGAFTPHRHTAQVDTRPGMATVATDGEEPTTRVYRIEVAFTTAAWVLNYRRVHRHGPTWRTLVTAQFGADHTEDPDVQHLVRRLFAEGWLAGLGLPFATRPGRRFWQEHARRTRPRDHPAAHEGMSTSL
ncbi:hypothetical protein [Embleya sp. NBC_00896]|uniref:hypothetical protein n=1 Tax=Embleya sp. NBC_00896 TaxID=2975961 RepID=UPI002F91147D|nr:hypothetical protein OG928_47985 [Embleya sp. NBC_00896]